MKEDRAKMTCRYFLASLGALLIVSSAAAQDKKPLRWGSDAEGGAPYIFKDPDHPERFIGFEVELAEALGKELGRPLQFTQYSFKELTLGLDRGDLDLAMDGLEITPDRQEKFRFSKPYYVYKLQLVGRKDESRYRTLKELRSLPGALCGTLDDSAAERLLKQIGVAAKAYDGQVEPYSDLVQARLDAVLLDLPIAVYYVKRSKELSAKLKFIGQPTGKGYYAIAFRKDNESLARTIDVALQRLKQNGTLRRILKKWGLWNESQEELMPATTFEEDEEEGAATDVLGDAKKKWHFTGYIGELLRGAAVTVFISVCSFALAVVLGLMVALCRLYGPLPVRAAATVYVEFFRGIPVLLLLYFLYYGLPAVAEAYQGQLGVDLSFLKLHPLVAAILGFGLNYAAYEAEIYRAGLGAVPIGQWEAAASLGMSSFQTFRRIVLPQAMRTILPPMTSDFVALFKDTSVVSIIAVQELSKEYQILAKSSMKYVEIGLVTAALYLIMSVPLGYLSRYLEKRWKQE